MATQIVGQGLLVPAGQGLVSQGEGAEGISVLLSDELKRGDDVKQNQWIVEISAQYAQGGGFGPVGRLITTRPNENTEPQSRIVAVASAPGAAGWRVTFRGAQGQKGHAQIMNGCGVVGVPGCYATRPRPRVRDRGAPAPPVVLTPFDTVLLSLYVSDASPLASPIPPAGLWIQFFNTRTPAVPGPVVFETPIASLGSRSIHFDTYPDVGDAGYPLGLAWALSLTPGVLTPVVGGQAVAITAVIA